MKYSNLDTFTRAYVDCALWSSTDDDDTPIDQTCDGNDIAKSTLERMQRDCLDFQRKAGEDIVGNEFRAGHDFWLTRNGHGAGFGDGDWPEETGERLTKLAKSYGEAMLYVDSREVWQY